MTTIERKIRCSLPLCESCRPKKFDRKVTGRLAEAGINSMYEGNESEADDAVWDEIDASTGLKTREIVQRIIHAAGDYCFIYPNLTTDQLTIEDREAAVRLGAEVTGNEVDCYSVRWKLPQCGVFPGIYIIKIDKVPWKQLKRDAFKCAKDRDTPTPKGDALLHCMKNTARQQYSNYCHFISWHQERQPFTDDGVKAIKRAYNKEIERVYQKLKTRK